VSERRVHEDVVRLSSSSQRANFSGTARRVGRLLSEPRRIVPAVRHGVAGVLDRTPVVKQLTRAQRLAVITADLDLTGLGLEIGPSHNPLLAKRDGYEIRIADYLDQAGLQDKYRGVRSTERIEEVDYVLAPGRMTDSISDRFDYIVGSHLVEHTVCLVSFLQDCEALLQPGGVLSLAVPDKRYCFDRFRERTGIGRVIDTYRAAPRVHTEGSVLEHNLGVVRKGEQVAWSAGYPGAYRHTITLETARKRAAEAAGGEYVDTHNWVFTPHHFRLLIDDLHTLGFIGLREVSFHDMVGPEFFVALSPIGPGPRMSREELLVLADRENTIKDELNFA
jgi:hypothetical protein